MGGGGGAACVRDGGGGGGAVPLRAGGGGGRCTLAELDRALFMVCGVALGAAGRGRPGAPEFVEEEFCLLTGGGGAEFAVVRVGGGGGVGPERLIGGGGVGPERPTDGGLCDAGAPPVGRAFWLSLFLNADTPPPVPLPCVWCTLLLT